MQFHPYPETEDELLAILRGKTGEGITTDPIAAALGDNNQLRMHAFCLELERRGTIYRYYEGALGNTVWAAVI